MCFYRLALWGVCMVLPGSLLGITLRGVVRSNTGEALPYATVAVQGTTQGTVADVEGNFALVLATPGSYTLEVRSLGYATLVRTLQVQADLSGIVFQLEEQPMETAELVITTGKDPAEAIMRKAIAHRYANDNAVRAYSADAYTKVIGKDRRKKKVIYLSESFSTLTVQKPNNRKEVIHNSRVSGDSKEYNALASLFTTFNPYQRLLAFPEIFAREFVSPVADNAFFFYHFKYLGNYKEGGQNIYKIAMEPRRSADPAFRGTLYIVDESYAIKGLDWLVTGAQPMRYFDSLRFRQDYLPVRGAWVPFKNQIYGALKLNLLVQKVDVEGTVLSVFSNYRITDPAPKQALNNTTKLQLTNSPKTPKRSKNLPVTTDSLKAQKDKFTELLRVEPSATLRNKDVHFWDSLRPTPLTATELITFHTGDSTELRKNSAQYLDSVNRFKPINLLTGYTFTNPANKNTFSVEPPLSIIHYNTVEGYNITLGGRKLWNLDSNRTRFLILDGRLHYGLELRHLFYQARARWLLNPFTRERLSLEAGDYISEFSPANLPKLGGNWQPMEQISPLVNDLYSLLSKQNYLKLFRQQGGVLRYYRRIYRDNMVDFSWEGWHRQALANHSNSYYVAEPNRSYTPNDQLNTDGLFYHLPTHYSTRLGVRLFLNLNRQYVTLPDGFTYVDRGLPKLVIEYVLGNQRGTQGADSLRTTYHSFRAQLSGGIDFKLLGQTQWSVLGGAMLSNGTVQLPDRFQVRGNQTLYRPAELDRFGLLDYYSYNTQQRYAEQHLEHNFQGFVLNKLPLIRKLKLHEIAGLHTVQMAGLPAHTELLLGLTNIRIVRVSLLRFNYHWQLSGLGGQRQGFTFTLGFTPGA